VDGGAWASLALYFEMIVVEQKKGSCQSVILRLGWVTEAGWWGMGVPARVQRTEEELVGCGGEGDVVLPHGGGKPALEENTAPSPKKLTAE